MKANQLLRAAVVLFFTLSLGACKVEINTEPKAGFVFWSKLSGIKDVKVDCYIDGQLVGVLTKVSPTAPDCNDGGSPNTKVKAGRHEWDFRLANGKVFKGSIDASTDMCYNVELE